MSAERPPAVSIRPLEPGDRPWVAALLRASWGSTRIVTRGRTHRADALPGYAAWGPGGPLGLLTYREEPDAWEIVSLDSLQEERGVGTALLEEAARAARASGRERLWLVTTNDNVDALRFYRRRGFCVRAVYRGAVDAARDVKPEIPLRGRGGTEIRDEIELERLLA